MMNAKLALYAITAVLLLGLTAMGCSKPDQTIQKETEQHEIDHEQGQSLNNSDQAHVTPTPTAHVEDDAEAEEHNELLIGDTSWGRIVGRGGLLYIEQTDGHSVELGEAGRNKFGAVLSDDGSKLLYAYEDANLAGSFPHLGVYHLADANEVKLLVDNEHGRQMTTFYWGSPNTVLVEGHINPSVTGYVLYNDTTGEVITAAGGMLHQILADEQSLLLQMSPHWQWEGVDNVLDLVIATANSEQLQLYRNEFEQPKTVVDIEMSDSMSTLAIWLLSEDGSAQLELVGVDPNSWKVTSTSSHVIPANTTGNIQFNEQEKVIMIGEKEQFPMP